MNVTPTDRGAVPSVRVERWIGVARERVFAALTRPELLMRWWGPANCTPTSVDVDLRVGGRYQFTIVSDEGDTYTASGMYVEVAPPERLVFTWAWSDRDDTDSRVTVDLASDGARTHLTLIHQHLPTRQLARSHELGWHSGLSCLQNFLIQGEQK